MDSCRLLHTVDWSTVAVLHQPMNYRDYEYRTFGILLGIVSLGGLAAVLYIYFG